MSTGPGHFPILHYSVKEVVEGIRSKKMELLELADGHSEIIEHWTAFGARCNAEMSGASGWLTKKQTQRVKEILRGLT
jgi:hypothetical protein